ncbi:MAG: hypothetical protein RIN55_01260 [Tissierellaceae bacterium]|nr:hypothetical protein [Tissierellaceae bacterium]
MKNQTKQFLIIAFLLGYLCFGIIAFSNIVFSDILSNPLYLFLLTLGFLSPFISSFIVYILNKKELGGFPGFIDNFKFVKSKKSIILVFVLLVAHYGFGIILKNVGAYGNVLDFFKYLPIMIVFLGSQEIGWRKLVQPNFEKEKGFYKSILITGLFWSLWFLPLIFIRGFVILPQSYGQFAAYLVGISFLLTTMYKSSKSILYAVLLSSLIFALTPVISLKQGYMLLAIAILEALVASTLRNKEFNT